MLSAPNIEYVLIIMSDGGKVKAWESQGYHTNWTYYKSGIYSIE
jgi:hypothetical protein